MASDEVPAENKTSSSQRDEAADFAKAFQELAKGERAASALEAQLTTMEARIEALLAQAERDQREIGKKESTTAEKVDESREEDSKAAGGAGEADSQPAS